MKKSLFASLFVVVAATASADDSRYVLSYTKADFDSVESVKALHRRIRTLATNHCPTYALTRDLRGTRDCVNDVMADLIDSINHPALSAYVEGADELRIALDADTDGQSSG